jgi:hypothetical protein
MDGELTTDERAGLVERLRRQADLQLPYSGCGPLLDEAANALAAPTLSREGQIERVERALGLSLGPGRSVDAWVLAEVAVDALAGVPQTGREGLAAELSKVLRDADDLDRDANPPDGSPYSTVDVEVRLIERAIDALAGAALPPEQRGELQAIRSATRKLDNLLRQNHYLPTPMRSQAVGFLDGIRTALDAYSIDASTGEPGCPCGSGRMGDCDDCETAVGGEQDASTGERSEPPPLEGDPGSPSTWRPGFAGGATVEGSANPPQTSGERPGLAAALADLADKHHRTVRGSRKHDPERIEDFRDCPCLTCKAAAAALAGERPGPNKDAVGSARPGVVEGERDASRDGRVAKVWRGDGDREITVGPDGAVAMRQEGVGEIAMLLPLSFRRAAAEILDSGRDASPAEPPRPVATERRGDGLFASFPVRQGEGELTSERIKGASVAWHALIAERDRLGRELREAVARAERAEGEIEQLRGAEARGRGQVLGWLRNPEVRREVAAALRPFIAWQGNPGDVNASNGAHTVLALLEDRLGALPEGSDGRQEAIDEVVSAWRDSAYVGGPSERDCARLTTDKLEPFATPDPQGVGRADAAETKEGADDVA